MESSCYELKVLLQNLYVEILTCNVVVLRGQPLGNQVGHGGEALINEISSLLRREIKKVSSLPCEVAVMEKGSHLQCNHAGTIIMYFQPP